MGTSAGIERVQTGVRMEKRMVKVLKGLAERLLENVFDAQHALSRYGDEWP